MDSQESVYQSDPDLIFTKFREGLSTGDISLFSPYLSEQTFLSLFSGTSGYHTSNQSYYLLQDFFNIYRPISFKYNRVTINNNPYATGVLQYESKGRRGKALVYIALTRKGANWQISQFSIK